MLSLRSLCETNQSTYVELSTRVAASAMESNHLNTEEVLSALNARWDADSVAALAVDHLLSAPNVVGETILLDLEPAITDTRVGGGVADLLQVSQGRALVGAIHNIIRRCASSAEHVTPESSDVGACLDVDDCRGGGGWVRVAVADHRVGRDIFDGPVVGRDTNTIALA